MININGRVVLKVNPIKLLQAYIVHPNDLFFDIESSSLMDGSFLRAKPGPSGRPPCVVNAFNTEPFLKVHSFIGCTPENRAQEFSKILESEMVIVNLNSCEARIYIAIKDVPLTVFHMVNRSCSTRDSKDLLTSSILYNNKFMIYGAEGLPFRCGPSQSATEFKKWVNTL